ncbi:MAG: monothiol bacilliredoxin BrxC family protein [Dehalococcoidia bacterium]
MTAATIFDPVPDLTALDHEFARSADGAVLLFLHDPYCPISDAAYGELTQLGQRVALIDVAVGRDLSRAVEQRTGVHHESPQVLVLHDGRAIWSASHGYIRTATVAAALDQPGDEQHRGDATDAAPAPARRWWRRRR